jgi:hypothetical protein
MANVSKGRQAHYLSTGIACALLLILNLACSNNRNPDKQEQIRIGDSLGEDSSDTTSANTIGVNMSLQQIAAYPQRVVLTGMPEHRLVTIYKSKTKEERGKKNSYRYYYDDSYSDGVEHFMPGIDLLFGYNLLNIAHYDLKDEKLNFLFDRPVLVKSLYYPAFVQDSINKKPVNRDYYLVSVYDQDTNADSVINKSDLRRFYYFNASGEDKKKLIPHNYSVVRSQYDSQNDVMYIFARLDSNNNGRIDEQEPLHVFWINLKSPTTSKQLY